MSWKEPTRYIPGGFVEECAQSIKFERHLAKLAKAKEREREYKKAKAEREVACHTAVVCG